MQCNHLSRGLSTAALALVLSGQAAIADPLSLAGKVHRTSVNAATCNPSQVTALAAELAATPNMDCTLVIPPQPLTAQGLATPYRLRATNAANGKCREANPNQGSFVEATIFDPATGNFSIYRPLVIDDDSMALVTPVVPKLPAGAVVGVWIGSDANVVRLEGDTQTCTWGLPDPNTGKINIFGQVSSCGGQAFFAAVNAGIAAGTVKIPALGVTKTDGKACPTTRSWMIVDQDQSDNTLTHYLSDACGNTAQLTPANVKRFAADTNLANGSDNGLLALVLTALGCQDWQAPEITDGSSLPSGAQALHEIRANALQGQPQALVPLGDPMTLINGEPNPAVGMESAAKTNLYRSIVDQPANVNLATIDYCARLLDHGVPRLANSANAAALSLGPTLNAAVGTNLYTFLGARFAATFGPPQMGGAGFGPTGCTKLLNQPEPVQLTLDGNGVATAVKFIPLAKPIPVP